MAAKKKKTAPGRLTAARRKKIRSKAAAKAKSRVAATMAKRKAAGKKVGKKVAARVLARKTKRIADRKLKTARRKKAQTGGGRRR